MLRIKNLIIASVVTLVSVGVWFVITPNDGLPTTVKIAKITYIAKEVLSELPGLSGDSFKEEENNGLTYRLLHIPYWVELGLLQSDIDSVMTKMQSADGERYEKGIDTIITYGPGNWVYEFEQLGDLHREIATEYHEVGKDKKAQQEYIRASMYYKVATFPGITRAWNPNHAEVISAYRKSVDTYLKYASYLNADIEEVVVTLGDVTVSGYLHIPKDVQGKVPATILTNGSDFFMTELYKFTEKLINEQFAVLIFDIPGIGASEALTIKPGKQGAQLHSIFWDTLAKHPRIDTSRMGIIGKSFGGNIGARFVFSEHTPQARFFVNYCGPIEGVSNVPYDVIQEEFPKMTIDAVASRFYTNDLKPGKAKIMKGIQGMGLVQSGIITKNTKTDVPILSYNTGSDPANPVWEMKLLTALSTNGKMIVTDGSGHCPAEEAPKEVIDWIKSVL